RKDSLYALTWNSLNLEHGTLTSLKSKNGLPQLFEAQDSLVALLKRWRAHQGDPPKDAPLVPAVGGRKREAEVLREDLGLAGIDRPDLLGLAGENAEPMRFHDLRATFVTWAMREGRGDGWISDRTGHLTPQMRARYARAARTLADLSYEPFPDLAKAIPELNSRPRRDGQHSKNPTRKTVPKTVPGGSR
ncbi:MAG TPA: hypothetical protein VHP33_39365, partial [Polyangiaceae bacterium]|nr:hypothetical protein [Polyangiaceae bacterium]